MSDEENNNEDVDGILNDLENEISSSENQVDSQKEADPTDKEELARKLLNMTQDDRKMADKIFQLFYPNLGMDPDKGKTSTKEAITRALELKISAGRNLIDLMKLLKEEQNSGNVGIFISDKKAGINAENLKDAFNDED